MKAKYTPRIETVFAGLLLFCAGCATTAYQPSATPLSASTTTASQARLQLKRDLKQASVLRDPVESIWTAGAVRMGGSIVLSPTGDGLVYRSPDNTETFTVLFRDSINHRIRFQGPWERPSAVVHFGNGSGYVVTMNFENQQEKRCLLVTFAQLSDAKSFLDAFDVLVSDAQSGKLNPEDEFAVFLKKAEVWRALATKPPLPEEANKNRVLAENAYSEKRFQEAADYYEQALEIEPCWPDGQFNTAMIEKELGDYADAADHMRRYLELVPDSKDAAAARDEIIIWEEKAKESPQESNSLQPPPPGRRGVGIGGIFLPPDEQPK